MRWPSFSLQSLLLASCALAASYACTTPHDPARLGSEAPPGTPLPDADATAPGADTGPDVPVGDASTGNGPLDDPLAAGVTYAVEHQSPNATEKHAAAGDAGAIVPPASIDSSVNCRDCHTNAAPEDGEAGGPPPFAAAGIAYKPAAEADAAQPPCIDCELLFVDRNGHRVRVVTAADGSFSIPVVLYGPLSADTFVGLRDGSKSVRMPDTIDVQAGGLQLRSCHTAGCHQGNPITAPP